MVNYAALVGLVLFLITNWFCGRLLYPAEIDLAAIFDFHESRNHHFVCENPWRPFEMGCLNDTHSSLRD